MYCFEKILTSLLVFLFHGTRPLQIDRYEMYAHLSVVEVVRIGVQYLEIKPLRCE